MYKIIATNDFVEILKDLPFIHSSVLSRSFVSIQKINDKNTLDSESNTFIRDLLEQIKNQELE